MSLRTVTEQVQHFAIFGLNRRGQVESWNPGAERLFGFAAPEIIGQDFAILFTPEDRAAGAPAWEMGQAAETALAQDERWHQRKDGTRFFVNGVLVAVRDETGALTGFTKVAQDNTRRKEAEDGLKESELKYRQLAAELEQRVAERTRHLEQHVQTWESFCYSIAHDLRAPLRTISGFAGALLEDYTRELDPTAQEYAARMMAAAQRLDEFIQDLLDFGRLAHVDLPRSDLDLDVALDQVLGQLAQEIATAQAEVAIERPLGRVWANPAALEQVLTNLITNAIKFVAPGQAARVRIHARSVGSVVCLSVDDNGIGIKLEHQERIFQLFERLHARSSYPGTGVGLAIVRKAMERMGGTVGVTSAAGDGSSFWIELPDSSAHQADVHR